MAPPNSLSIKTSSVIRLIKEEASYHKENVRETSRLKKLLADGDADKYEISQQKKVVEETVVMAPAVRKRLGEAVEVLEAALEAAPETESAEIKQKAIQAIGDGKKVLEEHKDAKTAVE